MMLARLKSHLIEANLEVIASRLLRLEPQTLKKGFKGFRAVTGAFTICIYKRFQGSLWIFCV